MKQIKMRDKKRTLLALMVVGLISISYGLALSARNGSGAVWAFSVFGGYCLSFGINLWLEPEQVNGQE